MASAPDNTARLQRLDGLKAKLKARDGKKGYEQNCEALREQIANLEKVIATIEAGGLDL